MQSGNNKVEKHKNKKLIWLLVKSWTQKNDSTNKKIGNTK